MNLDTLRASLRESLSQPVETFHLMLNVEHQRELLAELETDSAARMILHLKGLLREALPYVWGGPRDGMHLPLRDSTAERIERAVNTENSKS